MHSKINKQNDIFVIPAKGIILLAKGHLNMKSKQNAMH